jgi:secondary thiamine-phosphate synthase enzyme
MSYKEITIRTNSRTEFIDITSQVEKVVSESKIKDGICYLYVPHTTAGITINENADKTVAVDIRDNLNKIIPFEGDYAHTEGNSPAHIKSSIVGHSDLVFIENGKLKFGTWQGIFFCEFDGPRTRSVWIKIIEG